MAATFALAFITVSLSITLTCLLPFLVRHRENRHFGQRTARYGKWTATGLLLMIILSACGDSAKSSPTPTITPLALTVAAQPTQPGASSTAPTTNNTDWTTYHRDNQRTGYIPNTPDPHNLTKTWGSQLDGAVYAEPLVVGNRVIVATEGDTLYALDPATGNALWHTNIGTPVPQSSLPCGNINPLGITGTPVYDPATGLVFAVAEVSGPAHILVGVDVNTGQIKVNRPVDTDGMDP